MPRAQITGGQYEGKECFIIKHPNEHEPRYHIRLVKDGHREVYVEAHHIEELPMPDFLDLAEL